MNKKKKKMIDYGRYGYFFIAPFFITYLVFQLWPLINTFYYSTLTYYKRNGREFMEFAGLQNFVNILGMAAGERGYVLSYLKNTLVMWGCNFVPQILVSLLLAVWLTDEKVKVKGTGAMKVIVYLPSVITAASVSVLFKSLFSQYGPITQTLKDWGVLGKNFDFMSSVAGSRGLISTILWWMWFGNTTLLLIPAEPSYILFDVNIGTSSRYPSCPSGSAFQLLPYSVSSPPACRSSSLSLSLLEDNLLQYSYEKFLDLSFYSSDGPPLLHFSIKLSALHCHFSAFESGFSFR